MRKFFYSFVVIAGFGVYAWLRQPTDATAPLVLSPSPSSETPPIASTPVQAPSPPVNNPPSQTTTPPPAKKQSSVPVVPPPPVVKAKGQYNDGQYTGPVADAYYGNIQVRATIAGGKITDVVFLQYPNDRSTSIYINSQAMPYLKQEAIQAQSANVNIVSGATDSSAAFQQSLAGALQQAKG